MFSHKENLTKVILIELSQIILPLMAKCQIVSELFTKSTCCGPDPEFTFIVSLTFILRIIPITVSSFIQRIDLKKKTTYQEAFFFKYIRIDIHRFTTNTEKWGKFNNGRGRKKWKNPTMWIAGQEVTVNMSFLSEPYRKKLSMQGCEKWHSCVDGVIKGDGLNKEDTTFQEGLVKKVCEFRAVLHLSLPQPHGLTKAKWLLWFESRAASENPVYSSINRTLY